MQKNGPGSAAETEKFVSLKNVLTGKPMGTPVAGSMLRILRLRISTATPCGSRIWRGSASCSTSYPKDNTSGCVRWRRSACATGARELERRGFRIVGVSPDGERSHRNFCDKHALGFTLLSGSGPQRVRGLRRVGGEVDVRPQIHGRRAYDLSDRRRRAHRTRHRQRWTRRTTPARSWT